jgi:pimeloyl-ACP methyl ester carboxylesterase
MEKAAFRNSRRLRLSGALHIPEMKTKSAVVIAHGFASNMDGSQGKLKKAAEEFSRNGLACLRFDFSGCGESEGDSLTVSKQVDDLRSAISFARQKGFSDIALLGSSLGGLCSILAYDRQIRTMVLWAPVTKAGTPPSLRNRGLLKDIREKGFATFKTAEGRSLRVEKGYLTEREGLDQQRMLSQVRCPVLIIHGDRDDMVPLEHSEKAMGYLPADSRLIRIRKGSHNLAESSEEAIALSLQWLKARL